MTLIAPKDIYTMTTVTSIFFAKYNKLPLKIKKHFLSLSMYNTLNVGKNVQWHPKN